MSPEYSLKKLISAGFQNIFEITRAFRNEEEVSQMHNPEFTILEWYRTGETYTKIMEDFENLFCEIIKSCHSSSDISKWIYQGIEYDLSVPWKRVSVAQAFQDYAGIDDNTLLTEEKLFAAAKDKGYVINAETTWEQIFYQIFFNEIEPRLKQEKKPVFLFDYPASEASLARKKNLDPRWAERFEIFLAGLELGNCFSELIDPSEQRDRFVEDLNKRKLAGKTEYGIDEELIMALSESMPEVSGIAVGVDRLVMLAADAGSINETLLFPASEVFDLQV